MGLPLGEDSTFHFTNTELPGTVVLGVTLNSNTVGSSTMLSAEPCNNWKCPPNMMKLADRNIISAVMIEIFLNILSPTSY
jgi:hypothetical protein